jgi:hypothetical protein
MSGPPEKPRVEPEIIPPDRHARSTPNEADWMGGSAMHRIYVARLGPFSAGLLVLGIGLLAGLSILLLLGAFLLLIPIAGLLLATAVLAGLLRGHFGRSDPDGRA